MEFNSAYWVVEQSQAGQAWSEAMQANVSSVFSTSILPFTLWYNWQAQLESHPTTHLENYESFLWCDLQLRWRSARLMARPSTSASKHALSSVHLAALLRPLRHCIQKNYESFYGVICCRYRDQAHRRALGMRGAYQQFSALY